MEQWRSERMINQAMRKRIIKRQEKEWMIKEMQVNDKEEEEKNDGPE